MGGKFSKTLRVVHWSKGKVDIVGRNIDDEKYYLKGYDAYNWNPSIEDWYDLSGPYNSEPALIIKAEGRNLLYLFGVDTDNILRMQLWRGYEWQPSAHETWPLGNLSKPYPGDKKNGLVSKENSVLLGTEL
ncbi:hypothetical protein F4859DRAFT_500395 [Xylaria cf. heliscus]|nr:hypothetical protein F4859DRAFT_500395 [Xylaria cf. heliscus]